MKSEERERLRTLMEEAALFPPDDSRRQEVEQEIARLGNSALKADWLKLLTEDEELRIALRQVPVPANLEAELLSICDTIPSGRWLPFLRQPIPVLVMACVLLFGVCFGWRELVRRNSFEALQNIITIAINDHLNGPPIHIKSHDPHVLQAAVIKAFKSEVLFPELGSGFELEGGSVRTLGTASAVFSAWRAEDNDYSLFQFRLSDAGVSGVEAPQLLEPTNQLVKRSPCEVLYWSHGDYGFLLVANHGELLRGVTPRNIG